MAQYYDRYNAFRVNSEIKPIPGIMIPKSTSDKTMVYKQNVSRLDKLSNMYYNNPYSGWLIMLANPEYGGLEFDIPDMSLIRIPFPYNDAISRYITEVKNHKLLYGE
jgi:hypothetical protein